MDLQTIIITQLQEMQKTLEAMSPLPEAGSLEAIADHQGWMEQHERICTLERRAASLALMALPSEVAKAYNALEARTWTLLTRGYDTTIDPSHQERFVSHE